MGQKRWLKLAWLGLSAAGCSLAFPLDEPTDRRGDGGTGGIVVEPCEAGAVVGDCDAGKKCTLAVPGQGLAGGLVCGPAGAGQAWSPCTSDAACDDGLWCEEASGVCKPWCEDASLCPDGAACVVARRAEGTAVSGWRVCTAHCRLDNPGARCGMGANCVLRDIDDEGTVRPEGDCAASDGKTAGCLCQTSSDCAPGLRCDSNDLLCRAWCDAGGTCAGGSSCGPSLATYDGTGFGQCPVTMCFNN